MKLFTLLLLCALLSTSAFSQATEGLLESGDIVFQQLPCGGLCEAIVATTPCGPSGRFNHCGIVRKIGDSLFVVEAIGSAVQQTPIRKFLARDTSVALTYGRTSQTRDRREASATTAAGFLGIPYDDVFLPGDSALYCSELVYRSYFRASGKQPLFSLQPMTFRASAGGPTHPAWVSYYRELHAPVPEGLPGINPCAIAADPSVTLFRVAKTRF